MVLTQNTTLDRAAAQRTAPMGAEVAVE